MIQKIEFEGGCKSVHEKPLIIRNRKVIFLHMHFVRFILLIVKDSV